MPSYNELDGTLRMPIAGCSATCCAASGSLTEPSFRLQAISQLAAAITLLRTRRRCPAALAATVDVELPDVEDVPTPWSTR